MELLPLLYALLAAITGFAGADRVGVAAPVRVEASATALLAVVEARAVVAARTLTQRPLAAIPAVYSPLQASARIAPGAPLALIDLAGFANRRE